MGFAAFLTTLFEDGRVSVPNELSLSEDESLEGVEVLAEFEAEYRLHLPMDPPVFLPDAAIWAAALTYRACIFCVFRDLDSKAIAGELSVPCAVPQSPSVHYSVDLTFRFLPDLLRLARSAASDDPLLEHLRGWATQWPLSSVGIPDVRTVEIDTFAEHPSLLGLYVDRIIARGDTARLSDSRVREGVRRALGLFPELAPEMAKTIENIEEEEVA